MIICCADFCQEAKQMLALLPDTQKFWHGIPSADIFFFLAKTCCFGMLGASGFILELTGQK